ncbi:Uncharacterized protein GBIM_13421 [Gryllus bimaculatus]|nr:Uncharacterized protein GBIM_13421 [Gryllus bimaculatus]
MSSGTRCCTCAPVQLCSWASGKSDVEMQRCGREEETGSSDAAPFPRGEFDELKKNFRAVQEENFKLQAVITDVTEVNKRWQKYNNDRQLYVQRLLSTIQDQQEQMNKIVEDRVIHSKEVCDKVGDAAAPSLEALLQERAQLREEVARLTRQLESARREHREHVEVLEFQLKAHRDDWEAERGEKQQALHDKDAAERRVRELQRDLRALKQKFREEKLQNCTHCKCCEAHVSEIDQCNIFLPGSQVNMCRKNHAKTYRSTVHVPCTSSPLLPRGTTIFFSDDLVVDGDKKEGAKLTELSAEVSKLSEDDEEKLCVKCPENSEELPPQINEDSKSVMPSSELKFDGNNNSPKTALPEVFPACRDSANSFNIVEKDLVKDSWEVQERKSSTAELNLEHDSSVVIPVVNVTPSTSTSSIDLVPSENVAEEDGLAAGGVTIGFDSSGLASVMGFSHVPIAKSSSLPEKRELRKEGVNPLISRWSFDSYYTALPIARPPPSHNFGTSMDSLIQEGRFQQQPAPSSALKDALPPTSQKPRAQKVKYSEEGVATQTEDDVICPGCGQIFPPKMHLKFLDHFEVCQNSGDQKVKN